MTRRTANAIIIGMTLIFGAFASAAIGVITGTIDSGEYVLLSYGFVIVSIAEVITIIIVGIKENDSDKIWVGALFGVSITLSGIAAYGVHYALFANIQTTIFMMNLVIFANVLLTGGVLAFTAFVNDDFTR